ncbi:MAG: HAMP domain-containing sensor histidine kinase [Arcobacteraceae bacterium]
MRVEEKSILIRFVSFYHISTFILLSIIALLIYNMQYQSLYNLSVSNLETLSSKISSTIITSDMKNEDLDFHTLSSKENGIKFSLYDEYNKLMFSDMKEQLKVNFQKKNYLLNQNIITVDKSTLGHMNVYSIVMVNDTFNSQKNGIISTIILAFIIFYVAICAVGFYLIQLFMKPIENERKRLDNFIKDTTHELNTPITALMICTNKETPRNEKNMERIYLSAKRISEIYKDLTHLFLETNKKRDIQTIRLDTLIHEELKYFELLASKKNITTQYELENTLINIDKEDFKRIFSNIFSNAIKYNKRGGKITIILKNYTLIIEDNGIGIDLKDKKNIFNRYYRATTQDGGFGMGLNIVYKICQEYDIKIDVESKLQIGSTFSFDFTKLAK